MMPILAKFLFFPPLFFASLKERSGNLMRGSFFLVAFGKCFFLGAFLAKIHALKVETLQAGDFRVTVIVMATHLQNYPCFLLKGPGKNRGGHL